MIEGRQELKKQLEMRGDDQGREKEKRAGEEEARGREQIPRLALDS